MKRTVSIIQEGATTEIQYGEREPVDGVIQGFVQIHEDGTLTVPFRNEADDAFVFVLDERGARVVASEDRPPGDEAPVLWTSEPGERYVTFFPWGDFQPSSGYVSYGPFADLAAARAHARTLSSDPEEGKVARLEVPS
jgi:hypothetical protein